MKNIVLTGFMASGKTTVGKKLADAIGYKFIDTDILVEKKQGQTINEIFSNYGEEYFRILEENAVIEASKEKKAVIACGGGVVLKSNNIDALRKSGLVFNLNPTEDVIKRRLSKASLTRPLLKENDLEDALRRFELRKEYYSNCDFEIKIEINKSVSDIVNEILKIYREEV